jgi:hypothetical protein
LVGSVAGSATSLVKDIGSDVNSVMPWNW